MTLLYFLISSCEILNSFGLVVTPIFFNKIKFILSSLFFLSFLRYGIKDFIKDSFKFLPQNPKKIIFSGGGCRNIALMRRLGKFFKNKIISLEDINYNSDFIEAELIGYLAVRSLKNLPITFPGTTGVKKPISGGTLFKYL